MVVKESNYEEFRSQEPEFRINAAMTKMAWLFVLLLDSDFFILDSNMFG
jgi:hypothetical protein